MLTQNPLYHRTHDSLWMAGTFSGLRGGCSDLSGGWCTGHRGLNHPRSQDSLLPIRHLLINSETDSRVKWLVEKFSQFETRSAASKRPAIYSVHAEKWCLRVSVYCVCRDIHTNHNHSRNHTCTVHHLFLFITTNKSTIDQPRGLVVRVSDY